MEKYFKVSESELQELLADLLELNTLKRAGVDNWEDGGLVSEIFAEQCSEENLPLDEDGGYYDCSFKDLAKFALKKYYVEVE